MRAMEKYTQEVGGYPFLYADTFMTRTEFEEMFDLTGIFFNNIILILLCSRSNLAKKIKYLRLFISAYEQVRQKYHAEGAFPHLYDKIKPEIDVVEVGKAYMDPL